MRCIVTGAAGFIGSRLSRRLLEEGHRVTGIDCFTDYYPRRIKERNAAPLLRNDRFSLLAEDINVLPLENTLKDAEAVFHLAAQAGVRASWGKTFSTYIDHNIRATQRLLEAARDVPLRKFVYSSSSSVYGPTPDLPTREDSPTRPLSPYGVTKLAGEHLCSLYQKNFGLPSVSLRFFTVYGPAQRPDMAFHKFLDALARDKEISVYGDGSQTRDFTYVDDIVEACLAALYKGTPGETYNIGGGHRERLDAIIMLMEEIAGKKARIVRSASQKGDVQDTHADIRKAREDLGYAPRTELREGLDREWRWIRDLDIA